MRRLLALQLAAALAMAMTTVIPCGAHNITRILSQQPDFSTFNHYLTATHLAAEINRRQTITVLALSNSAMSSVLALRLPLPSLRNLLSLHVLVDYFDAKKLHQLTSGSALSSTVFQSTGHAPGTSGFVNITDHRAGKVSFSAVTSDGSDSPAPLSFFVKPVKEIPYNISVIQISAPLSSPAAQAPAPAATQVDFIAVMAKKGCKRFADLVTGDVAKSFQDNVVGGLTIFCPIDQAMSAFMPKFNKLKASDKTALLMYHAMPVYESIEMLSSANGVLNTLATDGVKKGYNLTVQNDGAVVTLDTGVTATAPKITGTLVDEDPLAVYTIDMVLEPRELFKPEKKVKALAPTAADAPAVAHAPKGTEKDKSKSKRPPSIVSPAPAGPDSQPADEAAADQNAGSRRECGVSGAVAVAAMVMMMALI